MLLLVNHSIIFDTEYNNTSWNDRYEVVSNAKLKMFSFLDKLKIPFYCLCGIMIALEIITGVIRSTGVLPMFISYVITLVVYVIVILGVSIVYLVMGIKLLRRMRVSHTIKVKRSNALRQVCLYKSPNPTSNADNFFFFWRLRCWYFSVSEDTHCCW